VTACLPSKPGQASRALAKLLSGGTVGDMDRFILRLGQPVWQRIWARIEGRFIPVETRIEQLEAAGQQQALSGAQLASTVDALDEKLVVIRQEFDAAQHRLNVVQHETSVRAGDTASAIQGLWARVEFVRREVLFEMMYGVQKGNLPDPHQPPNLEMRFIARQKVDEARAEGRLRLNLGCGHIPLPDYVNVDMRELPGVDIVAEAGSLTFEPGSVDEIFSAHLIEHFPQEATRRRILPHWHEQLKSGGILRIVTPDGQAMLKAVATGEYLFDDFREVLFGAQDYAGDFHYNLFTPDSLTKLLEELGFTDIQVLVAGRRNGKCFEFDLSAKKP